LISSPVFVDVTRLEGDQALASAVRNSMIELQSGSMAGVSSLAIPRVRCVVRPCLSLLLAAD
jgi:hypothetical protein